ncbi:MAG: hypothetical protein K0S12_1657, partial [Bacteroidetes bacterium]|nr:hypothetical protein [Bacteroidota bacterium]
WVEWDPQNKTYPASTTNVSGTITTSQTWAAGTTVLLQGPVYISNNSILTIQPGVTILGSKAVAGSALIICKGSQIMAAGTETAPIVFTSDQAPGSRAVGDWGGLIVLGNAAINFTNGVNNVEGLPVSSLTQYGGGASPNNNDNSGVLQYVRIEFGGYVYGVNQEINGLTMGGVGKGTTIEHVQVSFTNDDGFEWFGGNVNAKWLVSYRNLDDDFDTDNGYSGNVQYGLIVRDPSLADNPSVSTSEGFESDNDASGTTASPQTSGIFSNITLIGPYRGVAGSTIASGYRRSARLRRNTGLKLFNCIFMDTQRGVHIDGSLCETNAGNGTLKFKHNLVAGIPQRAVEQNTANTFGTNAGMSTAAWFTAMGNDSIHSTMPTYTNILVAPYSYTAPDYRPTGTSPALATASFTDAVFNGLMTGIAVTEVKKEIGEVVLAPNPADDKTILSINTNIHSEIAIHVYDISGKLTATIAKDTMIERGVNTFSINTENFMPGVYFVTLSSSVGKETVKLVVTK